MCNARIAATVLLPPCRVQLRTKRLSVLRRTSACHGSGTMPRASTAKATGSSDCRHLADTEVAAGRTVACSSAITSSPPGHARCASSLRGPHPAPCSRRRSSHQQVPPPAARTESLWAGDIADSSAPATTRTIASSSRPDRCAGCDALPPRPLPSL